jgi:hypothetical protein
MSQKHYLGTVHRNVQRTKMAWVPLSRGIRNDVGKEVAADSLFNGFAL